jgi:hypothetical protein
MQTAQDIIKLLDLDAIQDIDPVIYDGTTVYTVTSCSYFEEQAV